MVGQRFPLLSLAVFAFLLLSSGQTAESGESFTKSCKM